MESLNSGGLRLWRGPSAGIIDALGKGRGADSLWLPGARGVDDLPDRRFLQRHASEVSLWVQTSGSTAAPSWVGLSAEALMQSAQAVNDWLGAAPRKDWLLALPDYHVGGLSLWVRAHLAGSQVHLMNGPWSGPRLLDRLERTAAAFVSLVPTQLHDLVSTGLRPPSSLELALVGGGSLGLSLAARARELGWPVCGTYGMTEACSQIATERVGGAGGELWVLPHWSVSLDSQGALQLCGKALAQGAVVRESGQWTWHGFSQPWSTRDQVALHRVNGSTQLKFLGRCDSAIKILGELVHLDALQRRLEELSLREGGVSDLAIVDVPDARRGRALWLIGGDERGRNWVGVWNSQVAGFERVEGFLLNPAAKRGVLGKWSLTSLRRQAIAVLDSKGSNG